MWLQGCNVRLVCVTSCGRGGATHEMRSAASAVVCCGPHVVLHCKHVPSNGHACEVTDTSQDGTGPRSAAWLQSARLQVPGGPCGSQHGCAKGQTGSSSYLESGKVTAIDVHRLGCATVAHTLTATRMPMSTCLCSAMGKPHQPRTRVGATFALQVLHSLQTLP